ncbi:MULTISPECIES: TetR family transcriptional regulator [Lentzea]|uniref:TetR family transcriptional regulator n=1 Tax=Lentzea TaxID=165301 RepID=UPI0014749764|nr:TetR family transcriptional regulator [Lentzea atacamensis]
MSDSPNIAVVRRLYDSEGDPAVAAQIMILVLERDYDSINMGHIATKAGLARNTLYNHANDKRTLVPQLARRASLPLTEDVAVIAARSAWSAADRCGRSSR